MGTPLLSGRYFADSDNIDGASPVVIINETFSREFLPNEDPIGKRIRIMPGDTYIGCTIVGVVKDMKRAGLGDNQLWLSKETMAPIYFPHSLLPEEEYDLQRGMHLIVRTKSHPLGIVEAVRRTVWAIDKNQPVTDIKTMEEKVMDSVASRRVGMLQLAIFAGVALLLGVIGIYGVVAYAVAQRTKEIGIRMALGAQRSNVLLLVMRQSLMSALLGIAIGCAGAHLLTHVIENQLFGITRSDPATYIGVSIVLVIVVVLASYLPARRATKVDPMVALRYE
jgi:putative ABC transport system permease protein